MLKVMSPVTIHAHYSRGSERNARHLLAFTMLIFPRFGKQKSHSSRKTCPSKQDQSRYENEVSVLTLSRILSLRYRDADLEPIRAVRPCYSSHIRSSCDGKYPDWRWPRQLSRAYLAVNLAAVALYPEQLLLHC